MSQKQRVLSVYRLLLRSTKRAFQNDAYTLQKSHQQIREEFSSRRHLQNPQEIEQCIQNAIEANFVVQNEVVQGEAMTAEQQRQHNETIMAQEQQHQQQQEASSSPEASNSTDSATTDGPSRQYKVKLQDDHVTTNLDQSVFLKEIDEEMLSRMERKAAREERRKQRQKERENEKV